jgi:hypothetical protein
MTLFRYWKIVLALVAIILGSAWAGGFVGHALARRQYEARNDPSNWNEHVSREFDRLVKPAPEQATRIQAHLDKAVQELQVIRIETIARSTNVIWRLVGDVEQELTASQRQAFEAIKPKPSDLTLDLLKVKAKQERAP